VKGKLIKYTPNMGYIVSEHVGIIISYRSGYSVRKSWEEKISTKIEFPMIRVYWFNSPSSFPKNVKKYICDFWTLNENLDIFEANVVIDEWKDLNEEWFSLKDFEIIE